MGEKAPFNDKRVTHGCCPDCLKKREEELAQMRRAEDHFRKEERRRGVKFD